MQLADQFRALGAGMSLKASCLLLLLLRDKMVRLLRPSCQSGRMAPDGLLYGPALAWATHCVKCLLMCRLLDCCSAALLRLPHCTPTCWACQPLADCFARLPELQHSWGQLCTAIQCQKMASICTVMHAHGISQLSLSQV